MKYDVYETDREKAEVIGCGLKVLRGINGIGKPTLRVWKPKASKPMFFYCFNSEAERETYLQKTISNHLSHLESKREWKEKQKVNPDIAKTLKRGDIFFTSWGYDQTNYDYIVVLEVSPTGKTVKCQRTGSLHMGESSHCNVQEPIFYPFGDIFTMQLRAGYNGGVQLKGSYPFCHDGTGSRRLGSFSKVHEGEQFHETDAMFGH